jgi:hypothetical protein
MDWKTALNYSVLVLTVVVGAKSGIDWIRAGCPVPKYMHAIAGLAALFGLGLAWAAIAAGESILANAWIPFAAPVIAYSAYGITLGRMRGHLRTANKYFYKPPKDLDKLG